MRKLILLATITALVAGMVAVPAAAKKLDDGCSQVQVRGTTAGTFGETLYGTPRWHTSGKGKPVTADVEVSLTGLNTTSHVFDFDDSTIVTDDEVIRFEPAGPGLFEFDSVLTIVSSLSGDYSGTLYTKGAAISVDEFGMATATWRMKGFICEPSDG